MNSADVIVVGAGPTGLALAGELALAGVRVRLLERRREEPNITRAFALHARTLELLDARGLADEVLQHGVRVTSIAPVPGSTLDLTILDSRFPMIFIAPQSGTEKVLRAHAERLGVEIVPDTEVLGFRQDDDGVTVEIGGANPGTERARYLVGCDGAHSTVRRLAGIDFAGKQYQTHILLADVHLAEPPQEAMFARTGDDGAVIIVPFGDGWFRAIAWDRKRDRVPLSEPVTDDEMRDAFHRIAGGDLGMGEPRWTSRFLSERRQASRYRAGRVFLAGDAAHVHSPLGGQGMNTGIQDAMNLGWKLAAAVHGTAAPWLLDSYQAERHPVGEQVLRLTDAFNGMVLGRKRPRSLVQALAVRAILRFGRTRRMLAGRVSGIGVRYPARGAGAHRWAGRRMPDVGRLYEQLRDGRFVLVTREPLALGDTPGVTVVRREALPGPAMILVRPDGYVAWASDRMLTPAETTAAIAGRTGHLPRKVRR
ncbi:FAD-dependent oxidoreductase [Actinoplanes sp. NBRC 103695]|uniref:FAD-dependent oxidoreductase n=1 Tax=Actinoplanes sp. NBRC 103695 TaxID=3032202 RepID=UPI0025557D90|nr:FAD-dependent oxidoreductase [Actinoplanes sp. NBRC 103695]